MPRSREFSNSNTVPTRARRWLNNFLDFVGFIGFLVNEQYNSIFRRANRTPTRRQVANPPLEAIRRSQSSSHAGNETERLRAEPNPQTFLSAEEAVLSIGLGVVAGTLFMGWLFVMANARERSTMDNSDRSRSTREETSPSTQFSKNQEIINALAISGTPLSKNIRAIIDKCFSDKGFCCLITDNIMSDPVSLSTKSGGLYITERSSLEHALATKKENPWNRDPATKKNLFPQTYLKSTIDQSVAGIQKLLSTPEMIALIKQFDNCVAAKKDVMADYIQNIIVNRVEKLLDKIIAEIETQRAAEITENTLVKFQAPLPETASIETATYPYLRLTELLTSYLIDHVLNGPRITFVRNFQQGYELAYPANSPRALPAPPSPQVEDFPS